MPDAKERGDTVFLRRVGEAVLACLYLTPDQRWTAIDLMEVASCSKPTIHRAINKLHEDGVPLEFCRRRRTSMKMCSRSNKPSGLS
jgi:hypothetical protein